MSDSQRPVKLKAFKKKFNKAVNTGDAGVEIPVKDGQRMDVIPDTKNDTSSVNLVDENNGAKASKKRKRKAVEPPKFAAINAMDSTVRIKRKS